jgi:hypothetical protein
MEAEPRRLQIRLAVATVMLQRVACGLEHWEARQADTPRESSNPAGAPTTKTAPGWREHRPARAHAAGREWPLLVSFSPTATAGRGAVCTRSRVHRHSGTRRHRYASCDPGAWGAARGPTPARRVHPPASHIARPNGTPPAVVRAGTVSARAP